MELHEILERADAPSALVRWVRESLADLDQAWERCARPDHRIWLAAVAGAPIEALIEAAAAVVTRRLEGEARPPEAVLRALELALGGGSGPELLEAAEACEAVAGGGVGSYRDAEPPRHAPLARAAALVAGAAEGLSTGEARREAARLEQARQTGAFVGVGTQIALPARAGPARLDVLAAGRDPAQGVFLFAVAAAAEAALEASALEGATPADAAASEALVRELDALVRDVLESDP
jgi:hypothetical protein